MDRLKVAIADKILEVSLGNPEEMKYKLSKIQRFSDFAEACKTLMTKYPDIETELLEMVHDDDFDASRASRRVDSIISREQKIADSASDAQANQISEVIPIITPPPAIDSENDVSIAENETPFKETIEENEELPVVEEVFATENEIETETLWKEESQVADEINQPENEVIFSTVPEESAENADKKAKRKKQLTLLWQVLAIAVAVFVVVIVVKFVISYWKTILIVLGSLLVISLLLIFLKKRNKNKVN